MSYQPRVAPGRYTAEPVPKIYPGSSGWACICKDVKPYRRHIEPFQCVTSDDLDLWRAHYPDATCGDKAARVLIYLAKEFGP